MCSKCKTEAKTAKCRGCGDKLEQEINPNFDESKFEEMKKRSID